MFVRQVPAIREAQTNCIAFILERKAMLRIADIISTDFAAHEYGGASPEYAAELERVDVMIAALSADYGIAPPRLAEDARAALRDYAWPGNVRELRNELERVLLLVDEETIRAEHFRFTSGRADRRGTDAVAITATDEGLEVVLTGDRCPLDELEREVIRQALRRCRGNVSRAGRFLGISRQTLIYRLRKHGFQTATTPGLDEEEEPA